MDSVELDTPQDQLNILELANNKGHIKMKDFSSLSFTIETLVDYFALRIPEPNNYKKVIEEFTTNDFLKKYLLSLYPIVEITKTDLYAEIDSINNSLIFSVADIGPINITSPKFTISESNATVLEFPHLSNVINPKE